jgi:hypothetical protein
MKRIRFTLTWLRAFAASVLALCLVGSNAMSIGAGKSRIKAQSGAHSISPPITKVPEPETSSDSGSRLSATKSVSHADASRARINESYGKLPMSFEVNIGQADSDVKFIARDSHRSVLLTSDGAVMTLTKAPKHRIRKYAKGTAQFPDINSKSKIQNLKPSVLRFRFVGASASSRVSGLEQLRGKTNYLRGNDPSQWRTDVATFARVKYESLYPGVDLIYYGQGQRLEYDLMLAPRADPSAIAFDVQGANPAGNGLVYSTLLGGTLGESGSAIAVDSAGNAYMAGTTSSTNFPTASPFQSAKGAGIFNAFVAKLNATGSALIYSSYLGGSMSDQGFGLALDSSGNVYVTGSAASQNFPTTPGAFQTVFGGGQQDAFVAKVSSAGTLAYSTYLGGSGNDAGTGIAVDGSGNAYVTGFTQSANFPTANPFQSSPRNTLSAFVTKLNASGSALAYSSYLGGSGGDYGNGIAVDSAGNAYVIGTLIGGLMYF